MKMTGARGHPRGTLDAEWGEGLCYCPYVCKTAWKPGIQDQILVPDAKELAQWHILSLSSQDRGWKCRDISNKAWAERLPESLHSGEGCIQLVYREA